MVEYSDTGSRSRVMHNNYGIEGQKAPEWNVNQWFHLPDNKTTLHIADIDTPVIYLYNFQAWCPGCHSHGFPTMAKVRSEVDPEAATFVTIQTVFEGHDVNTVDRALESVAKHGLDDIPLGHDPGVNGGSPEIMRAYRTGGTPWTVIIGPDRSVLFNGFQLDADAAIKAINHIQSTRNQSAPE